MVRRNRPYFITAIVILAMLLVVSFVYLIADIKVNSPQLSAALAFGGTMGTITVVALALVAIGYSIKEADIVIVLPDKDVSTAGTLQQIRIQNRGNALGNMAHAFVEIEVPPSSPVSFSAASGLTFQPTQNPTRKQYRLDNPADPMNLYPGEFICYLLGFIEVPSGVTGHVKFNVQIVGTQGRKQREFDISI